MYLDYEEIIGGGVGGPQWGSPTLSVMRTKLWGFPHLIDYEDRIVGGVGGPQWGFPTPFIMRTELEVGLAGPNGVPQPHRL